MDIERLSKSQIILLTLLVSFVTSIATGIVTVSLMGQAPPSIAQSVNRIVERTVERVVPSGQSAATAITREKTVIVKESDLISEAVTRSTPSVARLYASYSSADMPVLLGLGVVLDSSGLIASDIGALGENADAVIELQDGTRARAFVTSRDKDSGVAFLQPATTTIDGKPLVPKPATIGVGSPMLGQTVIALAGKSRVRIAQGIVTALVPQKAQDSSPADIIETDISGDAILPGGILVNTDGEIIGISTSVSRTESSGGFISSSALMRQPAPAAKGNVSAANQQ
ncbi:MAG: serine protease [bacterium]|nr:serine protease [bacterium]